MPCGYVLLKSANEICVVAPPVESVGIAAMACVVEGVVVGSAPIMAGGGGIGAGVLLGVVPGGAEPGEAGLGVGALDYEVWPPEGGVWTETVCVGLLGAGAVVVPPIRGRGCAAMPSATAWAKNALSDRPSEPFR
jgi:hypothetical protein